MRLFEGVVELDELSRSNRLESCGARNVLESAENRGLSKRLYERDSELEIMNEKSANETFIDDYTFVIDFVMVG